MKKLLSIITFLLFNITTSKANDKHNITMCLSQEGTIIEVDNSEEDFSTTECDFLTMGTEEFEEAIELLRTNGWTWQ